MKGMVIQSGEVWLVNVMWLLILLLFQWLLKLALLLWEQRMWLEPMGISTMMWICSYLGI